MPSKFLRHFGALHHKNMTVARRNLRATLTQLTASFFFMFFVFIVDRAVQTQQQSESRYSNVRDPERVDVQPIPACEVIHDSCYTFAYSPQGDETVNAIVRGILEHNTPAIPADKVIGFAGPLAADDYMLEHPETVQAAVHFSVLSPTRVHFEIQFNASTSFSRGKFRDPNMFAAMPLQVATEREIVRMELNEPELPWHASFREFAHPAFRTRSIVGSVGPPFFFAGAMFGFVIQVGAVVLEREQKLRQAMEGMGLSRNAFWFSWLAFELLMIFCSSVLMCLFGVVLQFDLFLNNDISLSFTLIFLFKLAMMGLAFLLSTLTEKSASATSVGFVVFLLGFIIQIVVGFGFPFDSEFDGYWQVIFAFFPPATFSKGLSDLGKYTAGEGTGLSWYERDSYCIDTCVFSLRKIYWWYVMLFVLYFGLALWLDRVLSDEGLPLWFCFKPSFWTSSEPETVESIEDKFGTPTDEDVQAEAARVKERSGGAMAPNAAVEVRGLVKSFGRQSCGKLFHAVKGPWFEIKKNELFCLLGPNGAGKTTTINMLVGNLPPSEGQALEMGHSVNSPAGMASIRQQMGVCPQFDVQWGQLTAYEHLHLFGMLRGIGAEALQAEIKMRLEQVGLAMKEPWLCNSADAKTRVGSRVSTFSGGEKRRLSVAMSLMGDPSLVYLDEPTTGMDPISRREVWNLIQSAKDPTAHPGRAIVLTTHSMEEAEILGDRISIMAKGVLRCLGTSIRLKQRFGAGFTVQVQPESRDGAAAIAAAFEQIGVRSEEGHAVTNQLADGGATDGVDQRIAGDHAASLPVSRFVVPREKEGQLVQAFEAIDAAAGVGELTLKLTTLESVFLAIAKEAEIAEANGKLVKVQVESPLLHGGGREVSVQMGVDQQMLNLRAATNELGHFVLNVEWGQNEEGTFDVVSTELRAATEAEVQAHARTTAAA